MPGIIIQAPRLILREIRDEDFEDIFSIWSDAETMRFFPATLNREAMRQWMERNQKRYAECGHGLWAACIKGESRVIGDCGLVMQDVEGIEEMEVGYHFNKQFWGRGYATEAARACLDYAFSNYDRDRIISMIRPENTPSRKVAERNGLQISREIYWRGYQHYIYSITRAEWERFYGSEQ